MSEVIRRSIRNTGREFEEAFRCDDEPERAKQAAQQAKAGMPEMSAPMLRQIGPAEFSVHWWSVD